MAMTELTSNTQRRVARIVEKQLGIKLIGIVPVRGWDMTTRWFARSDKNADYESEVKLSDVARYGAVRGLRLGVGREILMNEAAKEAL